MISGGTIDHHKPINYVQSEVALSPGAKFTVVPDLARKTVTVSGACPACGGLTTADFPYGIGGSSSKGFRGPSGTPPVRSPVTVFCECGHAHAERPDSAFDIGCGRFWLVELKLP